MAGYALPIPHTDIVRLRVCVEPPCSGDSCSGDLRVVDGGDLAAGRLERRDDDRSWT